MAGPIALRIAQDPGNSAIVKAQAADALIVSALSAQHDTIDTFAPELIKVP
jgi:hypothetical protein